MTLIMVSVGVAFDSLEQNSPKPALHVIGGRLGCGHCRAQLPRRDHSRSSLEILFDLRNIRRNRAVNLLNGGDKDVLHPGLVKTSRGT